MKNKKVILSVLALIAVAGISFTIAYSRDRSIIANNLEFGSWKTVFTEDFDAPTNWMTCETIDKTITIKNESKSTAAVRIIIEEKWLKSDGVTELPLVSAVSGNQMAQINFLANSGWTHDVGGYYYYDTDLAENETTASLTTGVTLNCDANLDEDEDYANATYHLKFTAQSIQPDAVGNWKVLYDRVAMQTRGSLTDQTISYYYANATNGSGEGVFTYGPSENYNYPIYYYRGSSQSKNSVIFADYCWRIIRTTDTGGVKILYAGVPTGSGDNRQCPVAGQGVTTSNFNSAGNPWSGLYMYGSGQYPTATAVNVTSADTPIFYKGIHYNNGIYTFDDSITGRLSDIKGRVLSEAYRYVCLETTSGQCTKVGFAYATENTNGQYWYYDMSGVATPQNVLDNTLFANENNSNAKTAVDNWFASNMLDYEDKLEDTIFCVDRDLVSTTEKPINFYADSTAVSRKYVAYARNDVSYVYRNDYIKPTLECTKKNDSFTKNETQYGNGALDYTVGLITIDEAALAGAYGTASNTSTFLDLAGDYDRPWTLTPADTVSYPVRIQNNGGGYYEGYPNSWESINPVVSLKPGTRYSKGTGDVTDPYIVE